MSESYSTRLDDAVAADLEAYCEREGVTRSTAIAAFVEEGLARDDAVSLVEVGERLEALEAEVEQLGRDVNATYAKVRSMAAGSRE